MSSSSVHRIITGRELPNELSFNTIHKIFPNCQFVSGVNTDFSKHFWQKNTVAPRLQWCVTRQGFSHSSILNHCVIYNAEFFVSTLAFVGDKRDSYSFTLFLDSYNSGEVQKGHKKKHIALWNAFTLFREFCPAKIKMCSTIRFNWGIRRLLVSQSQRPCSKATNLNFYDKPLGMPVANSRTDVLVKRKNQKVSFWIFGEGRTFPLYFALEERKVLVNVDWEDWSWCHLVC